MIYVHNSIIAESIDIMTSTADTTTGPNLEERFLYKFIFVGLETSATAKLFCLHQEKQIRRLSPISSILWYPYFKSKLMSVGCIKYICPDVSWGIMKTFNSTTQAGKSSAGQGMIKRYLDLSSRYIGDCAVLWFANNLDPSSLLEYVIYICNE